MDNNIKPDYNIKSDNPPGTLFIVATPMGNLEDMSFRAIRVLKEVDLIAAEDTRHSRRLLDHYGIQTRMISCHEHNEDKKSIQLIEALKTGKNIALISDAGTPLISDPGYRLVKTAADQEISIIPIPGCNAAITGLSVAGLPTDSFLFCGFLPKKAQKQCQILEGFKSEKATLIFYESPKRICTVIKRARKILGNRRACLAREITKLHEEYIRGDLSKILSILELRERIKGECVLYIHGAGDPPEMTLEQIEEIILSRLDQKIGTADLARKISAEYQLPKKQIYDTILRLR
ncbi:MAG: 16S rRNA (cytidine(1402)-2'-O)-methyltransferase [Desulfobacteraceae bacterium 4572_89]|nr:MAG: 16S rRNA (cytidine(1402)-2'-O)-methyltransferase [Desulfobacteraceae bacterium 4572_89]